MKAPAKNPTVTTESAVRKATEVAMAVGEFWHSTHCSVAELYIQPAEQLPQSTPSLPRAQSAFTLHVPSLTLVRL